MDVLLNIGQRLNFLKSFAKNLIFYQKELSLRGICNSEKDNSGMIFVAKTNTEGLDTCKYKK